MTVLFKIFVESLNIKLLLTKKSEDNVPMMNIYASAFNTYIYYLFFLANIIIEMTPITTIVPTINKIFTHGSIIVPFNSY